MSRHTERVFTLLVQSVCGPVNVCLILHTSQRLIITGQRGKSEQENKKTVPGPSRNKVKKNCITFSFYLFPPKNGQSSEIVDV